MLINAANVVRKTPCMHWLTDKGCQYADRCRFTHTVLDYKDGRCFNCSGENAWWEKGVNREIREVRQKTPRWPKPQNCGPDLENELGAPARALVMGRTSRSP